MSRIERYVSLLVTLLLAGLCLLLFGRQDRMLSEQIRTEAQLQVQVSKAEAEILALNQEIVNLKGALLAAKATGREQLQSLLNDGDLTELKAQGLQNPAADLVQALQSRPDLIPHAGASAFDPPRTWVISRPWILAGWAGGRGLFRYALQDGQVTFTLVEAVSLQP